MSFLKVEGLHISFNTPHGVAEALRGVEFSVHEGAIFGVVGESGSGKSLTGKAILDLVPYPGRITSGRIFFENEDLRQKSERERRAMRGNQIGIIFQDPSAALNPVFTIEQQMMGIMKRHRAEAKKEMRAKALGLIHDVGLPDPERVMKSYPHELSGGMQQRVMIAMSLLLGAKLLIADEPTTALDVTIQAQILDLLKKLRDEKGLTIMLITHDMGVVAETCDEVAVFYAGEVVERGNAQEVLSNPQHDYTRALLAALPDGSRWDEAGEDSTRPLIEIQNLTQEYVSKSGLFGRTQTAVRILDQFNLTIYEGETLGVVGESGCGKSTLANTLMRLIPATAGEIRYDGSDILTLDGPALRQLRQHFQMVFQNPFTSLNPRMRVFDIVAEPLRTHRQLGSADLKVQVDRLIVECGLTADYADRYPHELSGGQAQRVAVARALALNPRFLILDEPTSALDVSVQDRIIKLLVDLQKKHQLTYLFISHDLGVVQQISDRIAVMFAGEIVELGTSEAVFTAPQHEYTQKLLAATPSLIRMKRDNSL